MTTIDAFRSSVSAASPPADVSPALQALWWLLKDDWGQAHKCVQGHEGQPDCDWVHAHLHRQEGDLRNAGGWYSRAGKTMPASPLQEEWDQLTTELLTHT